VISAAVEMNTNVLQKCPEFSDFELRLTFQTRTRGQFLLQNRNGEHYNIFFLFKGNGKEKNLSYKGKKGREREREREID